MADLQIQIQDDRREFSPGDVLSGHVSWSMSERPSKVELNLIWSTRGKGTQDLRIVETVTFANPQPRETRDFRLTLPASPYSFSGQLISLIWTLELNIDPGDESFPVEIVIAPGGKEVALPRIKA